ncbi:efflux RND transporter periplasmic adaptor subunit [Opitutus sp. ER46]|uniref:efflux RND transporter periplasmic adaptor subunit n=1 Tax=Opitutus sp. ER46 TaxID=2161864 RepID=UPI000D31ABAE|nr:efflux RND transporter periplasmic adaptor subunit [Opitutus sp. ER46]PTY00655.1 efflux RND transporter periplasmic adaptor subunit [Opitutus sp. ER46]
MNRLLLLSSLTLTAALVGCSRHEPAQATKASLPAARVQLAAVRAESLPDETEVTGTVRPLQRAQLAAKIMGAIEEFPVTLGQSVKRGDLLLRISAAEIAARVAQAQSQLNAARRDLERERSLLTKGASTTDMVRGLEDRFAGAEAMVREAETMRGYTEIRAPFDGVIARKLANAGDLAAPGLPLLELEGTATFVVEVAIPDSLAGALKPDAVLSIAIPADNTRFDGRIAEISSAADPLAHAVFAKVTVPAGIAVRSGQFARVAVPGATINTLTVPASAVTQVGQMQRVFVVGAENRATLRLVKTGATRGDRVEILAGVDANESVVAAAPAGLREGQPLEIAR